MIKPIRALAFNMSPIMAASFPIMGSNMLKIPEFGNFSSKSRHFFYKKFKNLLKKIFIMIILL